MLFPSHFLYVFIKRLLSETLNLLLKKCLNAQAKAEKAAQTQTAFGGFLAGKTALGASSAEKALNKKYKFDGEAMSVAEFVERHANDDTLALSTSEVNKYKGASRSAWNRMSEAEQKADEERVKNSGTKTVYMVNGYDLGKTAYEYAQHLIEKGERRKQEGEKSLAGVVEGKIYKNNLAGGNAVAVVRGKSDGKVLVAYASDVEDAQNGLFMGEQVVSDSDMAQMLERGELAELKQETAGQSVNERIAQAEGVTNVAPTDGQKGSGNYKKGHVRVAGYDISIEQPKGSVRSGVDANGNKWEQTMHNTYGYFRGTEGVDGDHIDVFLANDMDAWNGEQVFVVDQYKEDGSFDEHKVMLGFDSIEDAQSAYLSNYEDGWADKHRIVVTGTNAADFKKWVDSSHRKTKAFADYKNVKKNEGQSGADNSSRDGVAADRTKEGGASLRNNLADFKEGDVVRDYYDKQLYRIKKHSKNGVSTIAMLDEDGKEVGTKQMNAHNNSRYSLAEPPVKAEAPTISQESEQVGEQVGEQDSSRDGVAANGAKGSTRAKNETKSDSVGKQEKSKKSGRGSRMLGDYYDQEFEDGLGNGHDVVREEPKTKGTIFDFTSKDKQRPALQGVHHDGGYAIATDSFVMVGRKDKYDAALDGKTINKKGEPITYEENGVVKDVKYPNWKIAVPQTTEPTGIDIDDLASVIEGIRIADGVKQDSQLIYPISIKTADGKIISMPQGHLRRFLRGAKQVGATEVSLFVSERGSAILKAEGSKGFAIVIGSTGVLGTANSFYDAYTKDAATQVGERPLKEESRKEEGETVRGGEKDETDTTIKSGGRDGVAANGTKEQGKAKVEDVGEVIAGARKDALKVIASAFENATIQSLIELPFAKAFKKPDLKKAVESGALREEDAAFYEAWFSTMVNTAKPKLSRRVRESHVRSWAEDVYKSLQVLKEFVEADVATRDRIVAEMMANKFPTEAEELAKIEQRKEWNKGSNVTWGDKTTPNRLWVAHEVLKRLGYKTGDKIDIPYGVLQANATGTGYDFYNNKGQRLVMNAVPTVEEGIERIVYLTKLKRGDTDVKHPVSSFTFVPTKTDYAESGRYRVVYGSAYNPSTKEFDSLSEAEAFAKNRKDAFVSPIKEVSRQYAYKVRFVHPLTGEKMFADEKEFDTRSEAEQYLQEQYDAVNEHVNDELAKERGEKRALSADDVVEVVSFYGEGKIQYGVCVHRKYANNMGMPLPLRDFATRAEAVKYASEIKEDIFKAVQQSIEDRKAFTFFATGEDTRIGEDYRQGKDVTAEEFMDAFGFRGVQFGNWTNQRDRQMAVNQAYDALHDLAKLLGVSPKALSLNGELGIAFGSRGSGNANAHYELDEVVINLTKTRGAGSLAHEWWHALDNYFARNAEVPHGMVTDSRKLAMRDELREAFNALLEQVDKSKYLQRSKSRGDYWGRMHEVTARLLAEWVDQSLKAKGEVNTFLSRGADVEKYKEMNYKLYKRATEVAGETPMPYEEFAELDAALDGMPYPTAEEVSEFGAALRRIFDVIQERETEDGKVALFNIADEALMAERGSEAFARATEHTIDALKTAGVEVVEATDEMVEEVLGLAEMHKQKKAPETASVLEEHQPTVVSSADGAKLLKDLDSAITEYENKSGQSKTFLGDIAQVLGATKHGSNSQYATFEAVNGKVFTIRLANHNAKVSNFDNHGENEGISIVVTAQDNNGINNDGNAHVVEFFYDAIKLRKADGKPLVEILKSIKQALYSGEYKDTTGLAQAEEVNIEFLRTADGVVYGWAVGGKVYLTKEGMNPNTPAHEYTHLWAQMVEKADPKLWGRIVDGLRGCATWNDVLNDKAYEGIWGDDSRMASEVLSRLTGAENYRREMARAQQEIADAKGALEKAEKISALEKVKMALRDFLGKVKSLIQKGERRNEKGETIRDVETDVPAWMEFVDMALGDLYGGVNPGNRGGKAELMFIGEKGAAAMDKTPHLTKKNVENNFGGIWIDDKQEYAKFVSAVNNYAFEEDGEGVAYTDDYFYAYYMNNYGQVIPYARVNLNAEDSQDVVNQVNQEIKDGRKDKRAKEYFDTAVARHEVLESQNNVNNGDNRIVSDRRRNVRLGHKLLQKGGYFDRPELYVKAQRADRFELLEDDDALYRTSDEIDAQYPNWLDGTTTESGKHSTQVEGTRKTYNKVGTWIEEHLGKDVEILDASSGMGYGTADLRERGFNIEDVEPYQSAERKANNPATYSSYADIAKKYDFIISNAVLNVIPDNWRANVLHDMAARLKVGGQMFINTRKAGEEKSIKDKIELDSPQEVLVKRNGKIASYQRFFTPQELKAWVEQELGEGYKVEIANKANSGTSGLAAVVVTKTSEGVATASQQTGLDSEDTLFSYKPFGGNSGYVGYSMSKRAAQARAEGRFPKTDFKKEYGVTERVLDALVESGIVDNAEWHHTSMYGNRTPFYGWVDDAYAEIYAANKEVVKNIAMGKDASGKTLAAMPAENPYTEMAVRIPEGWYPFVNSLDDSLTEDERDAALMERFGDAYAQMKVASENNRLYYEFEANKGRMERAQREERGERLRSFFEERAATASQLTERENAATASQLTGQDGETATGLRDERGELRGERGEMGGERGADAVQRMGEGVPSDDAVSDANDLIGKALGKRRYGAKQRVAYAERVRRSMVRVAGRLAKDLHLDNVDIVTDVNELPEGKKRGAKGFYSKSTGRITIVVPNHVSTYDIEQTVLHEAVAHYGLRKLFGAHFDTFLDNVFENAEGDVRRSILELAKKNGWDFRTATEEYLASLAEDTDFENAASSVHGWWVKLKRPCIKNNFDKIA